MVRQLALIAILLMLAASASFAQTVTPSRAVPTLPIDTFDGTELSSDWTIADTGSLKFPRTTLNAVSFNRNVPVQGVKGGFFSTVTPEQFRVGELSYQGKITSRAFTLERACINLSIGGGNAPGKTGVALEIQQPDKSWKEVQATTGFGVPGLHPDFFPVQQYAGQTARIVIFDLDVKGYMMLDALTQSNDPVRQPQLRLQDIGLTPRYVNSATNLTTDYERRYGRFPDLGVSERTLYKVLNSVIKTIDSAKFQLVLNESPFDFGMRLRKISDATVNQFVKEPSSDLRDYVQFWATNCAIGAKFPYASDFAPEEKSANQEASQVLRLQRSVCGGSVLLVRDSCNAVFSHFKSPSRVYGVFCDSYSASDPARPNHGIVCMELGASHIQVHADPTRLQSGREYKLISKNLPPAERCYVIDPFLTQAGGEFYSSLNFTRYNLGGNVWKGDEQNRFLLVSLSFEDWRQFARPTVSSIFNAIKSGR